MNRQCVQSSIGTTAGQLGWCFGLRTAVGEPFQHLG